jgi:hypothetical protein
MPLPCKFEDPTTVVTETRPDTSFPLPEGTLVQSYTKKAFQQGILESNFLGNFASRLLRNYWTDLLLLCSVEADPGGTSMVQIASCWEQPCPIGQGSKFKALEC